MTGRHTNLPSTGYPPVADHPDRACNGTDPKTFFPEQGPNGHTNYGPAIAICRRCPYRQPCLDWALTTCQRWGCWGGTTPDERQAIRKTP